MIGEEVEAKIMSFKDLQEKLDDLKGEAILPNIVEDFEDTGYLSLFYLMLAFR